MSEILRDLGDGLVMRTADPGDAEELAAFNVRLHSDDPAEPETELGIWTRDLMSGRHPTTGPGDVTVVTDAEGRIVSSSLLISQRWRYEDVEFGVGRPELIATEPAWRRRGLVREQMEVLHGWSAARGEVVQAITGIPWYYRQFGYEMGLELGGGYRFFWNRPGNSADVKKETFRLRPATAEDIPVLLDLLEPLTARSMVSCGRDETLLRWEIEGMTAGSIGHRNYRIIEDDDGVAGFADMAEWAPALAIRQMAVTPGRSVRDVALFLAREMHRLAKRLNETAKKKFEYLYFGLGRTDPVYDALGPMLTDRRKPYAWYVRVPDLPGFLTLLGPVLERRLARSTMAGHTGDLKLNFYRDHLRLRFEAGCLVEVGGWAPKTLQDGDGLFPDLTFLSLLFGRASVEELRKGRADCYAKTEKSEARLGILFPNHPSHVWPIY